MPINLGFLNKWFKGNQPKEEPVGLVSPSIATRLVDNWKVYYDRKNVWNDLEQMDLNDEIISKSLDIIAERCTVFKDPIYERGFYIESEDERVEDVLNAMCERTDLKKNAKDITRYMCHHGVSPVEIVPGYLGTDLGVVRVIQYPYAYQFYKNIDAHGRLATGDPTKKEGGTAPYEQRGEAGKLLAAFYSWQLVFFEYGYKGGMVYPRPYLSPARKTWKRLHNLEDAMVVARMIRAYVKLIHQVMVPMGATPLEVEETVKRYKDSANKKLMVSYNSSDSSTIYDKVDNPLSATTDFFTPMYVDMETGKSVGGDVKAVEGANLQLSNLRDMEWHHNRIIACTKVPPKYLPWDLGKARFADGSFDPEEEQFQVTLQDIQLQFAEGIKDICTVELLLAGLPVNSKYRVIQPHVSMRNRRHEAQTEESFARAAVMLHGLGLDTHYILNKFWQMTPDEQKALQAAISNQIPVAQSGTITPEPIQPQAIPKESLEGLTKMDLEQLPDICASLIVDEIKQLLAENE